ncbi:hypothetical protein ACWDF1_11475, partial [Streptomyces coelicoflavus]
MVEALQERVKPGGAAAQRAQPNPSRSAASTVRPSGGTGASVGASSQSTACTTPPRLESSSTSAPHETNAGEAVWRLLPPAYDALVRNTKAFKEAVAQTLTELARRLLHHPLRLR